MYRIYREGFSGYKEFTNSHDFRLYLVKLARKEKDVKIRLRYIDS